MANPNQIRDDKGRFAKVDGELVPNTPAAALREPPFASIVELQRSYITHFTKVLRRSDLALRKDRQLQRQMRRDPDVMGPLFQRKSAVALLEWEIKPEDDGDPVQVANANKLEQIIRANLPKPIEFFMSLLDAIWYGPAAVQLTPVIRNGYVVPGEWLPIHSDTIAFNEFGDLYMYVGLKYDGEKNQGPHGMIHMLDEQERKLIVMHTHGRQGVDYEVAEEAGFAYAGRGLRDVVWFHWMMKQTALQFWMTWIERYGMGIRIGTYPDGNNAAKDVMEEVLENLVGDVSVVIPRQTGENRDAYSVEVQEVNSGHARTFADLIEGYLAGQIKELIIGQSATTEATSTGLGSSVADQHAETFRRIVQTDALNLEDSLTRDLVWKYHEMNFGNTPYRPRFSFSLEKNDTKEFMEAVNSFVMLGGTVSQRQARETLGLTEPEEGEPVLMRQPQYAAEAEYLAQQAGMSVEEMSEQNPLMATSEQNPLAGLLTSEDEAGGTSELFRKYKYALRTKADWNKNAEL
jgi:phage gp29-like protein